MGTTSLIPAALVGGGAIAPFHAKYLLSSTEFELVAIIDPYPPGKELAKNLSVAHFQSIAELVAKIDRKPELYIVCVPSALHVKLASEVLNVAEPKAILVEKPISIDSLTGQQLLSLAATKGCKVAVGHHRRLHPAVVAAKKALTAGRIGKLTAVSGVWTCKKNDSYYTVAPWRASRVGGGGPIWTNFIHDIDVLHFLVGSTVTKIWAIGVKTYREHSYPTNQDAVEEGATLMFQFANGVSATFIVGDNVPSPYGWEAATGENPLLPKAEFDVDCFRLFGTQGSLTVPDGNLWTYRPEDAESYKLEVGWNIPIRRDVLKVELGIPFQQQIHNLAGLMAGEDVQICSGEDGLAAVKVCEAIIRAIDENDGNPVTIS